MAGRQSKSCHGRSMSETFWEKQKAREAAGLIPMPTPMQLAMCMQAAKARKANKENGALNFLGNEYWNELLTEHRGQQLIMHYDPDNLHKSVLVTDLERKFICMAECNKTVGFLTASAAKEIAKKRAKRKKLHKQILDDLDAEYSALDTGPDIYGGEDTKKAEPEPPTQPTPLKLVPDEDEFNADEAFAQAAMAVGDEF